MSQPAPPAAETLQERALLPALETMGGAATPHGPLARAPSSLASSEGLRRERAAADRAAADAATVAVPVGAASGAAAVAAALSVGPLQRQQGTPAGVAAAAAAALEGHGHADILAAGSALPAAGPAAPPVAAQEVVMMAASMEAPPAVGASAQQDAAAAAMARLALADTPAETRAVRAAADGGIGSGRKTPAAASPDAGAAAALDQFVSGRSQ